MTNLLNNPILNHVQLIKCQIMHAIAWKHFSAGRPGVLEEKRSCYNRWTIKRKRFLTDYTKKRLTPEYEVTRPIYRNMSRWI